MTTTEEGGQQAIADALERINTTIKAISSELKVIRRRNILLGLSVALDILLSIGLAVALAQTNNTASLARSEVVARCNYGNQIRLSEKNLWGYIISESRKAATTPQANQVINAFQSEVNKTFAVSDCQNIAVH